MPIGDAEGVNSAAQHAYGFLRHNGKAETLYDAADLLRRRAGSELGHQFVRRKPRFANWRHARTGRQRHDWHVNETRAGRRAIPALQPISEAARGHLDRTLSPGARAHPHPTLGPVAAAAGGGGRGLAQTSLVSEAGAIGRESLRVLAKAGIDRIVNRADNGLPRHLRDHRRH